MKYNPEIFRAYDIRGVYGEQFGDEFGYRLGCALVEYLGAKKLLVSRDERSSSAVLREKVIKGITDAGCDVVDIGITSTPMFYFGVYNEGADGGVMVTASHLPPEYNGFKIARKNSVTVGMKGEFKKLQPFIDKETPKAQESGSVEEKNILDIYTDRVIKIAGIRPGEITSTVSIDAVNLVKSEFMAALNKLNISVTDKQKADVSFELDADGDRFMIMDRNGDRIPGDLVTSVLAGYLFPGGKVAHDAKFSRGALDYMHKRNIKTIRTLTGHAYVKEAMRKHDADFGGEYSSHTFYKSVGYFESSVLASLHVLKIMKETGKLMEELVAPVRTWFSSGELKFKNLEGGRQEDVLLAIKKVRECYKDGVFDDFEGFDGALVNYPDWWFILRPSSTHVALQLIVEAKSLDLMEQKRDEIINLVGSEAVDVLAGTK